MVITGETGRSSLHDSAREWDALTAEGLHVEYELAMGDPATELMGRL
jgi:hypothetical protein